MSSDGYDHAAAAAEGDRWMLLREAYESAGEPRSTGSVGSLGASHHDRSWGASRAAPAQPPQERREPAATASMFSVFRWSTHDHQMNRPLDDEEHRADVQLFRRTKRRLVLTVLGAIIAFVGLAFAVGHAVALMPNGHQKHNVISVLVWVAIIGSLALLLMLINSAGADYQSPNTKYNAPPRDGRD